VRYLLHMEQHLLLRRRVPPADSSPHHDPGVPVKYPDKQDKQDKQGGSFITRTVSMLLELTDPKVTSGGFRHDWRHISTGAGMLDSLLLELLMEAIGPPGVAAVSRMLAFRAAGRLRKAVSGCKVLLAEGEVQQLAAKARSSVLQATRARSTEALRTMANLLSNQVVPLGAALASVGQAVLLRRRLSAGLRLHSGLDASLVSESVAVLDGAALCEVQALDMEAVEAQDGQLPSLWDFVGDGKSSSPEEMQLRFRRKLARMGELPGFGDPLRQLMQVVPEGSAPADMDILIAVALVQYTISAPAAMSPSRKSQKRTTAWGAKTVGSVSAGSSRYEAHVSLGAGLAAFLQQLPRRTFHGTFQLCGLYLQSSLEDSQVWAEGAVMIQILGTCLELLGFPRSDLAEYVPQGLLDLWPAE